MLRYVGGYLRTSEEHCRIATDLDDLARASGTLPWRRRALRERAQVQATLAVAQAVREKSGLASGQHPE